jgi:hypothetical protein
MFLLRESVELEQEEARAKRLREEQESDFDFRKEARRHFSEGRPD